MNPATSGECGPWLSPTFGSPLQGATINPEILRGWGVRPSDWQFGASIQRELLPRTSVEVGYNRRWFQNFTVTDNRAVGPSDFDSFTIVAPAHAGLPGGGGFSTTYLDPRTLATDNYITFETDYGDARQQVLAWRRRERPRPIGKWARRAGRHHDRPGRSELLRCREPGSRTIYRSDASADGNVRDDRYLADAVQRRGVLHRAEDWCPGQHGRSVEAGQPAGGKLCGAQLPRWRARWDACPPAVWSTATRSSI